MTNEELWRSALGEIEIAISKANFITWFKNTTIQSFENGKVIIGVPNGFAKEWLENKYNMYILKALRNIESGVKEVSCVISASQEIKNNDKNSFFEQGISQQKSFKNETGDSSASKEDFVPHKTIALSINQENNLNPKYTFENFIVGGSNELARAACYAVSQNLGKIYNPLFIYGGVGLGKTHLLQSIGNEILKHDANKKVKYITSERFTNELIESIKTQRINEFKNHYQTIDLLIIDDVQFLSGKEKTQEEFFHIFNFLYQLNKQIVLSSDRAPKAIPTLEERLRSRFEGGMIADVAKADFETRLAILRKKALDRGLKMGEDVMEFIATNITHNIRELEGALNRIAVSSQLVNKSIDVDFVKNLLTELISSGQKRNVSPKDVINIVAEFYDISPETLTIKGRKKEIVKPRQVAMYLMRSELQYSFPGIGQKMGGRDHTTAIHAYEKINKELETNKRLSEDLAHLKERLYAI